MIVGLECLCTEEEEEALRHGVSNSTLESPNPLNAYIHANNTATNGRWYLVCCTSYSIKQFFINQHRKQQIQRCLRFG